MTEDIIIYWVCGNNSNKIYLLFLVLHSSLTSDIWHHQNVIILSHAKHLSLDTIRGNNYKLIQHHCHYDLRKLSFTNRVIPIWNSLPNHVVSADTIYTFKNRLDKFWSDQEVLYDYNTDLHGIGNRSLL